MIIDLIKQIFQPAPEYTLQALAAGTHALPVKQQKKPVEAKNKPVRDSFVINEQTLTFGFNVATAAKQSADKSTPNMLDTEIEAMQQKGLWGGTAVQEKTRAAKLHWFQGKTVKECSTLLGVSQSWTEKRYCVFNAALGIQEK